MRPRPGPALPFLVVLAATPRAFARTTFYDPSGTGNVLYEPPEGWQPDPGDDEGVMTDGTSAASLSFAFAGR